MVLKEEEDGSRVEVFRTPVLGYNEKMCPKVCVLSAAVKPAGTMVFIPKGISPVNGSDFINQLGQ